MRTVSEHGYTTYPRRFNAYRWYKPLFVGALFCVFMIVGFIAVSLITKLLFGTAGGAEGYDDWDFYTEGGAFSSTIQAIVPMLCLILAALIVKDRPISSYFSSMGGWRWDVFLKTFAVGLVLVGIPIAISCLMKGYSGTVHFTIGGFIIFTILAPLQGVAEELTFRGYIMQTVSSWCRIPAVGIIVQVALFTAVHPYNMIGVIEIAVSALMYALVCVCTKGLEAGSAMHIINNLTLMELAGFGFGEITADETISGLVLDCCTKVVFFLFILFADRKLHWFDKVKYDDVAKFNGEEKICR